MHWIDPDSLPSLSGQVSTFIPNPHGELDGFLLDDGTQIHFAPHLSASVSRRIKLGSQVTLRAFRPRGAPVWQALALEDASGRWIEDRGPGEIDRQAREHAHALAHGKRRAVEITGTVSHVLYNGKGQAHGVLLDDGTIVRSDPRAADDLQEFLHSGATIGVSGEALRTRWGKMVEADHVWHVPDLTHAGDDTHE